MTHDEKWLLKEKYDGVSNAAFIADCTRLRDGEPLAYVIGWIPFCNTRIILDSRPLIPRPETEYWTTYSIASIRTKGITRPHILDLCAGSGCIGVSVLAAIAEAYVDFAEIETRHHETILKNITCNGLTLNHTKIYGGSLFENITKTYDYILSNPPYIDPMLNRTEQSVRDFEPHEALYGGEGGIIYLEKIIRQAPRFLNPHGTVILEHEPEQSEFIARYGANAGFQVTTHTDQFGMQRFTEMVLY